MMSQFNVAGAAEQFTEQDKQNATEILKCILSAVFMNKKAMNKRLPPKTCDFCL